MRSNPQGSVPCPKCGAAKEIREIGGGYVCVPCARRSHAEVIDADPMAQSWSQEVDSHGIVFLKLAGYGYVGRSAGKAMPINLGVELKPETLEAGWAASRGPLVYVQGRTVRGFVDPYGAGGRSHQAPMDVELVDSRGGRVTVHWPSHVYLGTIPEGSEVKVQCQRIGNATMVVTYLCWVSK